ncbi:unnamed protein product [Clonostachys rosea f. rosea IK726]|uniref:Uncharacterized protein n=1 Tax=Clonostachys rosea f. rosea IK726 TaxID=1349383 RepID=A0ACA9TWY5_BIOOC|nr:unnamed protein product [Clonostachys rosea f. rosea IK726]
MSSLLSILDNYTENLWVWRMQPGRRDGDPVSGILKATRHRVCKPLADQQVYERASVFSFNHADQELTMNHLEVCSLILIGAPKGVNS